MKITIEFDHTDIVRADEVNLQGFFLMVQSFAKSLKEGEEKVLRESVNKFVEEKHAKENSKAEEKKVEKVFDRKEIDAEIKKIALEGKDKNISAKIKAILQSYSCEKLSDVPDEKIFEVLQKVQAIE